MAGLLERIQQPAVVGAQSVRVARPRRRVLQGLMAPLYVGDTEEEEVALR